jgi:hypothetical protein
MPASASGRRVALTPKVRGTERTVWAWAAGDEMLPDIWAKRRVFDLGRLERFRVENRPHDPPSEMDWHDFDKLIEEHAEVLVPLAEAVRKARDSGLSFPFVADYVRLIETMRTVAEIVERAHAKRRT